MNQPGQRHHRPATNPPHSRGPPQPAPPPRGRRRPKERGRRGTIGACGRRETCSLLCHRTTSNATRVTSRAIEVTLLTLTPIATSRGVGAVSVGPQGALRGVAGSRPCQAYGGTDLRWRKRLRIGIAKLFVGQTVLVLAGKQSLVFGSWATDMIHPGHPPAHQSAV